MDMAMDEVFLRSHLFDVRDVLLSLPCVELVLGLINLG